MGILKWIPYKDLLFLQERMDRIFDETFARYGENVSSCVWHPASDIYETEHKIILKVELPGLDINDIDVELTDNNLVLKGERKRNSGLEGEKYHRMECSYGMFHRTFCLSGEIDRESVGASLKNGVLEITIKKLSKETHKHIDVKEA
ncbi:MAG: Hsp20/alpha crystallin family protein [Deltaproteobacteria bacterium]|nr:Hsp20/alpha crystallin family protein [Deltaproteobacteria bacterium]